MAGADLVLFCPHRKRHRVDDVSIYCPECRRLVLIRTEPSDRVLRDVQIMALTVATLAAAVLFRVTIQIWPAYLYLSLALILLYAVVFSRGRATVSAATVALSLISLCWLAWWLIGGEVHLSGSVSAALHALPVIAWLASLAAVLLMRRWALPVVQEPGTYVLAVGVFVLGFWGVWASLLQGGLVSTRVYQIAIVLALLAPVAFIPLIRKWRPYKDSQGSLIIWGAIVVAYLMVADLVVRGVAYVLGQLFPRIVGVEPLSPVEIRLLRPDVRAVLTVGALGIILLIALTDSIVVVGQRFRAPLQEQPDQAGVPAVHPPGRLSVGQVVGSAAKSAEGPSAFVAAVARELLAKFRGFARLINLVIPVITFTALSILLILVLDVFREYNVYGAFPDPKAIWGMAILAMFLALVGFAVAVYYAPWAYDAGEAVADASMSAPVSADGPTTDPSLPVRERAELPKSRARARNWPSIVSGSAVLFSGFYVFVSLASLVLLAVWLTLWTFGRSTQLFTPGPVYLINVGFVVAVVVTLLVLGVVIDWAQRRRQRADRVPSDGGGVQSGRIAAAARYILPLTLGIVAIAAMVFGTQPMIKAVSLVLRAHDAQEDDRLRLVVPTDIVGRCARDHLVLADSHADLRCTSGERGGVVTYHLFASGTAMNQFYRTVLSGRGYDPDAPTCATAGGPSPTYLNGQVGCYLNGGAAWIVWTDERSSVLSIYYQSDAGLPDVYGFWRSGALGPLPPAGST